jgi:hypothetical protein
MTRLVLALAAAAALALPGAASAKELTAVETCGVDGCRTVRDRDVLSRFEQSAGESDVRVAPARPAPFYVVRVTVDGGDQQFTWENFYVPSARTIRGTDERKRALWQRAPEGERAILDSLAAGVTPFSPPEVVRATVGRKTAADPASYLALYRLQGTRAAYPRKGDWIRIRLYSTRPSPWTDGANVLAYSPSARVLQRDGELVRVPKRVGRQIRTGAALHLSSGETRAPGIAFSAFAGALPLLAAAAVALRRRKTRGRDENEARPRAVA